jgi:molybdopterin-guanine dinucleotide biosynthesis protein A
VVLVGSTRLEGCRRIDDAPGVAGPVAGIVAALADRGRTYGPGRLVVASCDLVRPDRGWLGLLTRALDDDPLAVAAAFRDGERWQPFPMIATTSALPVARAFVDGGGESVGGLLERCGAAGLAWPGSVGGPPQANTPEELAKALSSDPAERLPPVAQGLPRYPGESAPHASPAR